MNEQSPGLPDLSATLLSTVASVEAKVDTVSAQLASTVIPVQKTVFKRFPILFTLLVTFGVAAIFFAFERILTTTPYLHDRPWLILAIGIAILVATGSLYRKLG